MTQDLILEPTATAQWHHLLRQAEDKYGHHLDETMESYLVFALMRFMQDQSLASTAIALDYLGTKELSASLRDAQLRDIGDQCLILTGLFPKRAERRLVRVGYYVDIGRSAYSHLSSTIQHAGAELYEQLAEAFVLLMDILQTIREFTEPALNPLQAQELWSDTGSRVAFNQLAVDGFPLHECLIDTTRQ